jgi:GMP synthase PP-ATPase subunit
MTPPATATLEIVEEGKQAETKGKKILFPLKGKQNEVVEKWMYEDSNIRLVFCVHVNSKNWTRKDTADALRDEISKEHKISIDHVDRHLRFVSTRPDGVDIVQSCRRYF